MGVAGAALTLVAGAAAALLFGAGAGLPVVPNLLAWLAICWLHANLYLWMAPTSRIDVIHQRGRFLGFGFALGVAAVSALGFWGRWPGGPAIAPLLWFLAVAWPFALPFLFHFQPGRPSLWDAPVLLYAALLPAHGWFTLSFLGPSGAALASGAAAVGHFGLLAAGTLAATYFLGVRQWQEVSNYWFFRRKDAPWIVGGAAALAAAALLFDRLWPGGAAGASALSAGSGWPEPAGTAAGSGAALGFGAFTGAIATAAVVQELFFRGLCQPGLLRAGRALRVPGRIGPALAIALASLLFALPTPLIVDPAGAGGAATRVAAGLILGWVVYRTDHLLPAIVAHGLGAALLAAFGIRSGLI